jgi:putative DNA primase/helicase
MINLNKQEANELQNSSKNSKKDTNDTDLLAENQVYEPNNGIKGVHIPELERLASCPPEKETNELLKELLGHISARSPREAAGLSDDAKLSEKDLVVITVEFVLEVAAKNKWPMARYQNFFFIYTGTHWRKISEDELKSFLGNSAENIKVDKLTARHYIYKNNLHNQFHTAGLFAPPSSDQTETKINLSNGTFVITKDKQFLKPFDPSDFMLYKLDFGYNPSADAPRFQAYLDRVLPDKSKQEVLAEYLGYVFIKNSVLKLEKALILYGDGQNGKSVLFDVIMKIFGPENISNFSLQSLTDDKGYHRSMLTGKLLNYASEISTKLDTTRFKMLVSGEPIEARQIYGKPFILENYARMMFNTNVLPKDIENNTGFFRRFIIIHFDQLITETEKDVNLANSIIADELPGVFNWVLVGLRRLLKQGDFTKSPAVENILKEFKLNSDSVFMYLDDGDFTPDPDNYVNLKDLYLNYREYCKDSGYTACSNKTFSKRLRTYQYVIDRKQHGRIVYINKKS